ncbi:MAG: aldolase/citrate lyase family protein [Vicinamibacteria bacterium]
MRSRLMLMVAGVALVGGMLAGEAQERTRLNPVIGLLEQGKPVFGLYAPSNRRFGPQGAAAPAPEKTPLDLAREAMGFTRSDYVFDGSLEGNFDRALPGFTNFVKAMHEAGGRMPTHPLIIKTPDLGPAIGAQIATELNLGVSGLMFPKVESAAALRAAIAAMRFTANGGTRPDDVGMAPAYWGMSEAEYRRKADLWPLNPEGELINWTIIESKEGLANVREIAAVPGVGVLWPGAGTLRGVFSTTDANGNRVIDQAAWENAIQTVLAACKEFKVACGYPANANDIEMRMKQGFSVFVMGWGEAGFKAVDAGRRAGKRDTME